MKFYDFAKAKEIAKKFIEKKDVTSISLGMKSDWFWTSEEIWNRNNGFLIDLDTVECIGGINGSFWDTPVLRVLFDDGLEEWEAWRQCVNSKEEEDLCNRQNERRKKMLERLQQLEEKTR